MIINNYINNRIWRCLTLIVIVFAFAGCGNKTQTTVSENTILVEKNIGQEQSISVEPAPLVESASSDAYNEGNSNEQARGEAAAEDDFSESKGSAEKNQDDAVGDDLQDEEEKQKEDDLKKEDDKSAAPVTPGSVESVSLNLSWQYADFSKINSGTATLYRSAENRKNVVIGVNAGHGTSGGQSVKTYCHPDMSAKVTGGTTSAGATTAVAVSGGMSFSDGTSEASVALKTAEILKNKLLADGYDVLMLRDGADVQLDNIARTVIGNNVANCIISLHWDGDNLSYDKGCFYISTPDGIKGMEPVASHWQQHEALGKALLSGLQANGCKIYKNGSMSIDLTQTSYSTVPSVDVELGNAASAHDDGSLTVLANGLVAGIESIY